MIKSVQVHMIQYSRNQALKQQKAGTHTCQILCEHEDLAVLWNQKIHNREKDSGKWA
jgi:hypothetical protein